MTPTKIPQSAGHGMGSPGRANYVQAEDCLDGSEPMIIRDIGPWDRYKSVTNAAEVVVEELIASGRLLAGQQLLYYDSENQLDEIVHKDGKFTGFAPGPRP